MSERSMLESVRKDPTKCDRTNKQMRSRSATARVTLGELPKLPNSTFIVLITQSVKLCVTHFEVLKTKLLVTTF